VYYVATREKPYPNDKLYGPTDLNDACDWARTTAVETGLRTGTSCVLDVLHGATGTQIHASYDERGHNVTGDK